MQRDQAHRTNELLERIAIALEKNNKKESIHPVDKLQGSDDIPGFEGTLDALDDLCNVGTNPKNDPQRDSFEDDLTPTSSNPDPAGYGNEYTYETDLQGIRVDSDHDIRSTASYYTEALASVRHRDLKTKKDCILDYVTNEFGLHGARYTDIIKFAYYLGSPNAPKYSNYNRGYYSCAFSTRMNGHLITGGKDQLVKGINKEGKERYYSLCHVDAFTAYWKRLDRYTESRYQRAS